ncbi:MAG: hypothetical protein EPN97_06155 [Alphaproteobacteria bacterium]|nr:MAG: hypothetical protein EPN97_06155 [Alphaproteobacteria bacterium]
MQFLPKEYRNPETLKQALRDFQQQLDAAEKLDAPADRLVAALDVARSIRRHAEGIGERLGERGSNLEAAFYLSTAIGGALLGFAVTALSAPVGFTIMAVGIATGMTSLVTNFIPNKMQKLFFAKFNGHLEELDSVNEKASQLVDLTLKAKTVEIASSAKFDSVYDNYPEVRDHFIKTFNKAVAKAEVPAQEPSAPPPATKAKLAL